MQIYVKRKACAGNAKRILIIQNQHGAKQVRTFFSALRMGPMTESTGRHESFLPAFHGGWIVLGGGDWAARCTAAPATITTTSLLISLLRYNSFSPHACKMRMIERRLNRP